MIIIAMIAKIFTTGFKTYNESKSNYLPRKSLAEKESGKNELLQRGDSHGFQMILHQRTARSQAIEGDFVDNKCPFTGDVAIRGRILRGVVKHKKMKRTITVRREYLKFIPKFNRYERRHKHISAHCSPAFATLKEGDQVVIGECRPLAKTIRYNVLQVIENKNRKMFIEY